MGMPRRILQWQADHPVITWIAWGIIWVIVFILLFQPRAASGL